jgi:hypothetical protein
MLSDLEYEDFDNFGNQIQTKTINYKNNGYTTLSLPGEIYKIYQNETKKRCFDKNQNEKKKKKCLAAILEDNTPLTKMIKGEKKKYNDFLPNIKKSFQTAGVPIHIKSGTELDKLCPKKDPSDLDDALSIKPLGIFVPLKRDAEESVPSLPSIFLAGDRIAEVATELKISYTNLAYIVRIHEIMHWLFQWKEKPNSRSREYEYIEESMANYMTLLWIDWLVKHINDCPVEKFLLNKTKSGLKKDAIEFMKKQPEAYAVAVQLYKKCNPFGKNNNNVLPFINWCFQKNEIKNENRTALVKNLRDFYQKPKNYSTNDIIKWYKALFA